MKKQKKYTINYNYSFPKKNQNNNENFEYVNNSPSNIKKGDITSFLRNKYEVQKIKIRQENFMNQAEKQKYELENKIQKVEQLRHAFKELLPKVMDSINIKDSDKFSVIHSASKNKINDENGLSVNENNKEIDFKNNNINNSNLRSNFLLNTNSTSNKVIPSTSSSKSTSNKNTSYNNNFSKKPAYEVENFKKDLFYNNNIYFLKNKYKSLLK